MPSNADVCTEFDLRQSNFPWLLHNNWAGISKSILLFDNFTECWWESGGETVFVWIWYYCWVWGGGLVYEGCCCNYLVSTNYWSICHNMSLILGLSILVIAVSQHSAVKMMTRLQTSDILLMRGNLCRQQLCFCCLIYFAGTYTLILSNSMRYQPTENLVLEHYNWHDQDKWALYQIMFTLQLFRQLSPVVLVIWIIRFSLFYTVTQILTRTTHHPQKIALQWKYFSIASILPVTDVESVLLRE